MGMSHLKVQETMLGN